MKTVLRSALLSLALIVATTTPVLASTSTDFYMTLLRRGTADVEAGRNADATATLRLAAFGLLDSIEHYQIAQAYLAVAFDRLGQTDQAREAAQRIVTAERVEKRFRSIALPAAIRTAFDAVAKKVLSASDAAALRGGATAAPAQTVPTAVVDRVDVVTETRTPATNPATTTTTTQPPLETAKPQPQAPRPQPVQPPRATTTQPQTTQPARPQPQTTQPQTTQPQTQTQTTTPVQPPPTTTTTQPQTTQPARPQPQTTQPQTQPQTTTPARPQPQTTQPAQPQRAIDVAAHFAAGERALTAANISEARRIYRELLGVGTLDHGQLVRVAEGFYRSRDFANVLVAFERAGALRPGEEPYRYYIAVAAFEVGQYERARRELAAALPHIELTPDVQRYRVKIEGMR